MHHQKFWMVSMRMLIVIASLASLAAVGLSQAPTRDQPMVAASSPTQLPDDGFGY